MIGSCRSCRAVWCPWWNASLLPYIVIRAHISSQNAQLSSQSLEGIELRAVAENCGLILDNLRPLIECACTHVPMCACVEEQGEHECVISMHQC